MAKYKQQTIGSISPIKGKKIVFSTPHRIEMILLAVFIILMLWFDVIQNQVVFKGVDHPVVWFDWVDKLGVTHQITTPAIDWQLSFSLHSI